MTSQIVIQRERLRKGNLVRFSIKERRLVFILEVLDRVVVLERPSNDDRSWRRPNSQVNETTHQMKRKEKDKLDQLLESIPADCEIASQRDILSCFAITDRATWAVLGCDGLSVVGQTKNLDL
jgi:hypothetical protein